eukprot:m.364500 g.364500  ORF g.364500 m.364500 type:complete len:151 (-) comp28080_c0_seq9:450-902(-)
MAQPWSATRVVPLAAALSTLLGVALAGEGGDTNAAISPRLDVVGWLVVGNLVLISLAFLATTIRYLRMRSDRKRELRESQRVAEWDLEPGPADSLAPPPPHPRRYGAGGAVVFNGTAFHENPPSPNTKVVGGAPQRHSKRSKRPTTTLKN